MEAWMQALGIWVSRCRASGMPTTMAHEWWDDATADMRRQRTRCLAEARHRGARGA
jgi:hypothetical protein